MQIYKFTRIGKTYRHLKRYEQILSVLISNGFGELIFRLGLDQTVTNILNNFRQEIRKSTPGNTPERLRFILESLGPTFIKIGQILSTRENLLPQEYVDELTKLQDQVAPVPFSEIQEVIEEELHMSLVECFRSVDPKPLGVASIGQVHRAELLDGTPVVIKVQRPDIDKMIETDLEIVYYLARIAEENIEELQHYKILPMVDELAQSLEFEINYNYEESNILRFNKIFEGDPTLKLMHCYPEYTTSRLIVLEYIEGICANKGMKAIKEAGLDPSLIAQHGANAMLKQVFEHGFYHADPHPGNIILTEDQKICFIDLGLVGRMNEKTRDAFTDLLIHLSANDARRAARSLLKICQFEEEPDRNRLETDISILADRHLGRSLKETGFQEFSQDLMKILRRHHLFFPSEYTMVLKSLISLESLGAALDPDFNPMKQAEPFIRKSYMHRYNPKKVMRDLWDDSRNLGNLATQFPQDFSDLVNQIQRGKLNTNTKVTGSSTLYAFLSHMVKRISYSLILSSLIIGSALIVLADIPPKWRGFPLVGMAGFLSSSIIAFLYLFREKSE